MLLRINNDSNRIDIFIVDNIKLLIHFQIISRYEVTFVFHLNTLVKKPYNQDITNILTKIGNTHFKNLDMDSFIKDKAIIIFSFRYITNKIYFNISNHNRFNTITESNIKHSDFIKSLKLFNNILYKIFIWQ